MKILICTPSFYPNIGGLATMNLCLLPELVRQGCEIVLVADGEENEFDKSLPYKVIRNPKKKDLWFYYKWCDVFFHNAPVIKWVWPSLFFSKPFVVAHHSCTFNWNQQTNIQSRIKKLATFISNNIVVSHTVAKSLGIKKFTVIPNLYDSEVFKTINHDARKGFVFVGRLSHEKGLELLIRAYSEYVKISDKQQPLKIIGEGFKERELKSLVEVLKLEDRVTFLGKKQAEELCTILNNSNVLVLPTTVKEAFGIVILEAMACGCYCIGSDGDGIEEAMGEKGILFKKGDTASLVQAMLKADKLDDDKYQTYCTSIAQYLVQYRKEHIASQYLSYFTGLVKKH